MSLRQTRIRKELAILLETKFEGIKVILNESQIDIVQAEMYGPEGSRFQNELCNLELKLPGA